MPGELYVAMVGFGYNVYVTGIVALAAVVAAMDENMTSFELENVTGDATVSVLGVKVGSIVILVPYTTITIPDDRFAFVTTWIVVDVLVQVNVAAMLFVGGE